MFWLASILLHPDYSVCERDFEMAMYQDNFFVKSSLALIQRKAIHKLDCNLDS